MKSVCPSIISICKAFFSNNIIAQGSMYPKTPTNNATKRSYHRKYSLLIAANHLMLTYKEVDFRIAYNQSSGLPATKLWILCVYPQGLPQPVYHLVAQ